MPDKYGVNHDPACYPGTETLKNLLNITDPAELEEVEQELTAARSEQWEPTFDQFDLSFLQSIHRHLFQDIFPWAGETRNVDISKGDTHFCNCRFIEKEANKLFSELKKENTLQGLDYQTFIQRVAHYYCELNVIHPFREGNGRVQRLFFEVLIINAGWDVNWSQVARREWISANISGFNGNIDELRDIFSKVVNALK